MNCNFWLRNKGVWSLFLNKFAVSVDRTRDLQMNGYWCQRRC
uniref:Uncharacterized protein n=1 Tax=Arabidopsis thaliana TaxID=3702 RepID=Q0WMK3_ARATH|nr:hypothetical protein [Arabidopsis thaliana]